MFSWVTAVRVLSLAGSYSPPHLPRMPSNTVLISGPAERAAQILTCSDSSFSCLQCPQLREVVCFLLWELSMTFYTFQIQSLPSWSCGFNLYSGWEGFGSSLATPPLGFTCGFIFTSGYGSPTGACSSDCPRELGFALERASCLSHRGSASTGRWRLGQL